MNWIEGENSVKLLPNGRTQVNLSVDEPCTFMTADGKIQVTSDSEGKAQFEVETGEGLLHLYAGIWGALAYPDKSHIPVPQPPILNPIPETPKPLVCENLTNPHAGGGNHHGYYDAEKGLALGTVSAGQGQGEALVEGVAIPLQLLAYDRQGVPFMGYKQQTSDSSQSIALRSHSGCPWQHDNKQLVIGGVIKNRIYLNKPSVTNMIPFPEDIEISHSCDIQDENAAPWFWSFNLATTRNLTMAVAGQDYSFSEKSEGIQACTSVVKPTAKDFIIKFRDVNTNETFALVARGTSLGGHFSTVYTYTCVVSGATFVSTYLGETYVSSTLDISGETFDGGKHFGGFFSLGKNRVGAETTATFGFEFEPSWCQVILLGA
jgi:hypothetical protein